MRRIPEWEPLWTINNDVAILLILAVAIAMMPLLSADCISNDSAAPDGEIHDCVHIDLDHISEFTSAIDLIENCLEDEKWNDQW
jgi:hypothetical protein